MSHRSLNEQIWWSPLTIAERSCENWRPESKKSITGKGATLKDRFHTSHTVCLETRRDWTKQSRVKIRKGKHSWRSFRWWVETEMEGWSQGCRLEFYSNYLVIFYFHLINAKDGEETFLFIDAHWHPNVDSITFWITVTLTYNCYINKMSKIKANSKSCSDFLPANSLHGVLPVLWLDS